LAYSTSSVARATEVLSRAFQSDPFFDYLLPRPEVRSAVLPALFDMVAGYSAAHGELDLAADGWGVACWLRPGHTLPTAGRLLCLGLPRWRLWQSLAKLGIGGALRLSALAAYADRQHRRNMPEAHWYLWALGVEPARQRQGVEASLLRMGLARADADRKPCYLETNTALNVLFYQKHGFRVVNHGQPAGYRLTFWAMRREPQ